MINRNSLNPSEKIASFYTGTSAMHIASDRLYTFMQQMEMEVFNIPLTKIQYEHIIKYHNLNEVHVLNLSYERIEEPVLFGQSLNSICFFDGRHRYVRRYRNGYKYIAAYIAPEIIVMQFQIDGLLPQDFYTL